MLDRENAGQSATGTRGLTDGSAWTGIRPTVPQTADAGTQPPARVSRFRAFTGSNAVRHVALLLCYVAAGVLATWPLATYLRGRLPGIHDPGSYVWSLWWVAHQVSHLSNFWFTPQLAAPVGVQLGYDTLMPLLGVLMLPVTMLAGPVLSYNLLIVVLPGVACYLMFRVARLWISSPAGAIAAGALFGLSTMLTWQDWYHLNIAAGTLFLPLALEASVRLHRRPSIRRAVLLGLVLGLAVYVNQESAIMAGILAILALAPWVASHPSLATLRKVLVVLAVSVVLAIPQFIAMAVQARHGGASSPTRMLADSYVRFGVGVPALVAPSPRLTTWGLGALSSSYQFALSEGTPTYGLTLTVLALAGLAVSWRRRNARLLALLWLGSAALAMGAALKIGTTVYRPLGIMLGGVRVSAIMPFTWLIEIPGLSAFREADRFALLGLVPAVLLAGSAVAWLAARARTLASSTSQAPARRAAILLVVAFIGAALEAGWAGRPALSVLTASLPAVDRPIAADHSGSIVVDVPFGLMGGLPKRYGNDVNPDALVLAAQDGHPRAISYTSWIPRPTVAGISHHAFYTRLIAAQRGYASTPYQISLARRDAQRIDVGWVLVWRASPRGARHTLRSIRHLPEIFRYLSQVGFRFDYQADNVSVYRPPASWHRGAGQQH